MKRMSEPEHDSTSQHEPSLFWTKTERRAFEGKRKRLGRSVFWASVLLGPIFFRHLLVAIASDLWGNLEQEGFRSEWLGIMTNVITHLLIATLLAVVSRFIYTYVETGEFGD